MFDSDFLNQPKADLMPGHVVGILGDGQLAYFLTAAAQDMGAQVFLLPPGKGESFAHSIANRPAKEAEELNQVAALCSWLAIENEGQALELGEALDPNNQQKMRPSLDALKILADKGLQKDFLTRRNLPTPRYQTFVASADNSGSWLLAMGQFFPEGFVLKWTQGGYDGRGVQICRTAAAALAKHNLLVDFIAEAVGRGASVYAEECIEFDIEMALVTTRGEQGQLAFYPLVLTEQQHGVCRFVRGPATAWGWDKSFERQAQDIAAEIGAAMQIVGTFALEFFARHDGTFLINEIAPRVHNSGHFSLSACPSSQFENHWRAIAGLKLGETEVKTCFAMVNILGHGSYHGPAAVPKLNSATSKVFWYEKCEMRPGRKMGHINLLGASPNKLEIEIELIQRDLETWSGELHGQGQN